MNTEETTSTIQIENDKKVVDTNNGSTPSKNGTPILKRKSDSLRMRLTPKIPRNNIPKEVLDRRKLLAEKKEKLRKLHMVQTYRHKNDLEQLEKLILKWREASQDAVIDLQKKLPEENINVGKMLIALDIDKEIIQYDDEQESFY